MAYNRDFFLPGFWATMHSPSDNYDLIEDDAGIHALNCDTGKTDLILSTKEIEGKQFEHFRPRLLAIKEGKPQ